MVVGLFLGVPFASGGVGEVGGEEVGAFVGPVFLPEHEGVFVPEVDEFGDRVGFKEVGHLL